MGAGNPNAAQKTERAIGFFKPEVVLFVGVAGGLKDVKVGDVVVATKVYSYHSGKAEAEFKTRPEVHMPHYRILERARAEAHKDDWLKRLQPPAAEPIPQVFLGAIAAGEQVVVSEASNSYQLIRQSYGDALAVEMESHGFFTAVQAHSGLEALAVRGISDHLENKAEADAGGSQPRASRHAAAFAFEVLAKLNLQGRSGVVPTTGTFEGSLDAQKGGNGTAKPPKPQELPGCAKPDPVFKPFISGEVGDFSPSKPAFNVPFDNKGEPMIGREDALEQVHRQLQNGKRTAIGQTAAFQGLGGLGKTRLAVEYAHAYRGEYPNGVIWLYADQDIIPQLIRLAEDSRWVSPLSDQKFKVYMAIKRLREYSDCLIIFDNLESQDAIQEFLPAPSANPHILVTSRLEQPGFTPIPLPTLTPELGLRLLLQLAGRTPDTEAEQQAARDIVERLDGLPLALELAGAYLRRRSCMGWQEYEKLLHDLHVAFPPFLRNECFTRHEADLYSTLKIHAALFKEEPLLQPVLDALTWSGPAAMSVPLLCQMLGLEKSTALSGALSLGCELRILQRPADPDRYAIHRLVREVRRADIPLEPRRAWAEQCVKRQGEWFETRRRNFRDLPLYEANLDHLQAWRQNAAALDLQLEAARLTWLEAYPGYHWGRYNETKKIVEQALQLYDKSIVKDGELRAHLLNDLSWLVSRLGDTKTALMFGEEALAMRLELYGERHVDTALSLSNVTVYYGKMNCIENALKLGEKSLAIRRILFGEDHPDTATSLSIVAGYYSDKGNTEVALTLGEQSLAINQKLFGEYHPNTAESLNRIAHIYNKIGNIEDALKLGEQALDIRRKLFGEEHPDTAGSINNVAIYYGKSGDWSRALELGKQAYVIRKKLFGATHPDTVLSNYNIISHLANANKRPEAFQRLEQQLKLIARDHPHYEMLQKTREWLLQKPLRPGFRQPSSKPGKGKKRR